MSFVIGLGGSCQESTFVWFDHGATLLPNTYLRFETVLEEISMQDK